MFLSDIIMVIKIVDDKQTFPQIVAICKDELTVKSINQAMDKV
jgi:hypothetical protein